MSSIKLSLASSFVCTNHFLRLPPSKFPTDFSPKIEFPTDFFPNNWIMPPHCHQPPGSICFWKFNPGKIFQTFLSPQQSVNLCYNLVIWNCVFWLNHELFHIFNDMTRLNCTRGVGYYPTRVRTLLWVLPPLRKAITHKI